MKYRPIIFSGPMVKAILDGRKTQTRRVIKSQPTNDVGEFLRQLWPCRRKQYEYMGDPEQGHEVNVKPFAFPGDRLWVRETFWPESVQGMSDHHVIYKADNPFHHEGPWKPSIHMPKWASRITLGVVNVRVERVQEISVGDCMDEGCPRKEWYTVKGGPEKWFKTLWGNINAKRGFGWDQNPWVWVIEFKKGEIECQPIFSTTSLK